MLFAVAILVLDHIAHTDSVCALVQQQRLPEASGSGFEPFEGQTPSPLALHPHLPAKRLNPDADLGVTARPHSLAELPAKSSANPSAQSPGIGSAEGNATTGKSQNAFALLMKASKGNAKGQLRGTAGGQLSTEGSHAASHAKAAARSGPQGGWQETLQRVAADPER